MSHIVTFPTAPNVKISENGDIVVTEVLREGVRKLEAYVEKMSSSDAVNTPINVDKVHASVLKLWNVVQSQPGISEEQVSRIKDLYDSIINSLRGRRVLPSSLIRCSWGWEGSLQTSFSSSLTVPTDHPTSNSTSPSSSPDLSTSPVIS